MKFRPLPCRDRVVIERRKLTDYCLNPGHRDGKHKARVFLAALGLTAANADWLEEQLREAARIHLALPGASTAYGERYQLDFHAVRSGRRAAVRSTWIRRYGEDTVHLTSCYVIKESQARIRVDTAQG